MFKHVHRIGAFKHWRKTLRLFPFSAPLSDPRGSTKQPWSAGGTYHLTTNDAGAKVYSYAFRSIFFHLFSLSIILNVSKMTQHDTTTTNKKQKNDTKSDQRLIALANSLERSSSLVIYNCPNSRGLLICTQTCKMFRHDPCACWGGLRPTPLCRLSKQL